MGIRELLSRHLISYARDEKWLHDLMDEKKDRSQLYKKAMKFYINNANDPEFRNIPMQEQYKVIIPAPVGCIESVKSTDSTEDQKEHYEVFEVDPNELISIMNGGH